MLELDGTRFSPKISQVMSATGWGLPLLDWSTRANQTAKNILNGAEIDLFKPHEVLDEPMSVAVRALLYLWAGWPADCDMWAAACPEVERAYIVSLAQRHQGKAEESKAQMQQLAERPLDAPMAKFALSTIGDHTDAKLTRFKELVKFGDAWEPFAFTDIYQQARQGDFSRAAEETIRTLQWQEFNLMLQRCYLAATGVDVTKHAQSQSTGDNKPAWKKNQPPPRRSQPAAPPAAGKQQSKTSGKSTPKEQAASEDPKSDDTKSDSTGVRIKCPKCQKVVKFPESARGHSVRCPGCSHGLRISGGDAKDAKPSSARVKCPKCGSVASYSEAHRNKKVACLKCRSSFLFAA
jgi:ribosomal protein S27E